MLTSLALIFLGGLAAGALCQRLRLPRIVGMLVAGALLGPYVLNWLDESILSVSASLRRMALVIILLRAGLSLELDDLKRVGRPALLMSCVPAACEILGYVLLAPRLLGVSRLEAAILGAVLGAVSPAVVVPRMMQLMESGWGTAKRIPQLILAGLSCDDVFVIVLFTTFTNVAQGGAARWTDFLRIPVSVALGVVLGAAVGLVLTRLLGRSLRDSVAAVAALGVSFLLLAAEEWTGAWVSGLLAVMAMGCALRRRGDGAAVEGLTARLGGLWTAAELVLFVLVGAAVDLRYAAQAGPMVLAMLLLALACRALGVLLCLLGTPLNRRERLFCVIAYLPKATVQAAIGAVPLAMGLPCGALVLAAAVLGILVTAPLGAIGIDASYRRLLSQTTES